MLYQDCIQLGFNPRVMDWKKEDYDKVVASINDNQNPPYHRGWIFGIKNIKKGQRVFVYYASKKKFIASGYVFEDGTEEKEFEGKN